MTSTPVPLELRRWFVAHFVADITTAVPLFLFPDLLRLLGWTEVDPIATRLVAAALIAIGVGSWVERNAGADVYRPMLNMKLLWSGSAVLGLLWSQLAGGPLLGWGVLAIFAGFHLVWIRCRLLLAREAQAAAPPAAG